MFGIDASWSVVDCMFLMSPKIYFFRVMTMWTVKVSDIFFLNKMNYTIRLWCWMSSIHFNIYAWVEMLNDEIDTYYAMRRKLIVFFWYPVYIFSLTKFIISAFIFTLHPAYLKNHSQVIILCFFLLKNWRWLQQYKITSAVVWWFF